MISFDWFLSSLQTLCSNVCGLSDVSYCVCFMSSWSYVSNYLCGFDFHFFGLVARGGRWFCQPHTASISRSTAVHRFVVVYF
ncbi:hypothetical protein P692DRAFT_201270279 [Suillus brevipes Sb2]|nr:hypothetical protein P692DRAFT_201270279 [Suillus brevipes Sb2]